MYRFFILVFTFLVCFGCNSDQSDSILELEEIVPDCEPGEPESLGDLELDLDEDGIADFKLVYSEQTTGDPIGNYREMKLVLESSDIDQVLRNEENQHPMFLNNSNLIEAEVAAPLYWEVTNPSAFHSFPIARIRTEYDEITWNDEWRVFSLDQKETYLIGFKLLCDNSSQFGFIECSIDLSNGEFTLLKTEFL